MKIQPTVRLPALIPALLLTWALSLTWAMSSSAGTTDTPAEAAKTADSADQETELLSSGQVPNTEGGQSASQDATRPQPPTLGKQRKLEERNKDVFRPSEEISEDFAAPLPTDI